MSSTFSSPSAVRRTDRRQATRPGGSGWISGMGGDGATLRRLRSRRPSGAMAVMSAAGPARRVRIAGHRRLQLQRTRGRAPAGAPPPGNRRRPPPTTRAIARRSSSIRPAAGKGWASRALPRGSAAHGRAAASARRLGRGRRPTGSWCDHVRLWPGCRRRPTSASRSGCRRTVARSSSASPVRCSLRSVRLDHFRWPRLSLMMSVCITASAL